MRNRWNLERTPMARIEMGPRRAGTKTPRPSEASKMRSGYRSNFEKRLVFPKMLKARTKMFI